MATTTYSLTVQGTSQTWQGGYTVQPYQSITFTGSGEIQWTPGSYSQVEGAYSGSPTGHELHLPDLSSASSAGIGIPGWNLGLAIYPVADGVSPGTPTPGAPVTTFKPKWTEDSDGNRVVTIYPSDLFNTTRDEGPWDVYVCYNDGNYADNLGSYSFTVAVTDISDQHGIQTGLPGYITDEDLETARHCAKTGILVPGNRLVYVDGRPVWDAKAPYANLNHED